MSEIADKVDAWLEPLDDAPCGDDLEYDSDFLALNKAAEGKAETQFSSAEPPDWGVMADLSEQLLGRTRDVRLALMWGRSMLHREGFVALPHTLRMVREWFERYWDDIHPKPDPDDGDLFARMNSLAQLEDLASFLGDVRQSTIVKSRAIGQLTVRDIEVALERLPAREDEAPMEPSSITQMLTDAISEDEALRDVPAQAQEELNNLLSLLDDKAGYGQAPSCDTLKAMLAGIVRVMPSEAGTDGSDAFDFGDMMDDSSGANDANRASSRGGSGGGGVGDGIESRADAIRAIDLVCEFLERAEPTNPAQMFLRRAQKLIDKNFLELVKELAPDALAEVAKIMGVDPSSMDGNGYDE